MSERAIQNEVLLAASEAGYTLFRNNVGTGWAGEVQRLKDGSILIRNPRPLHAGLCKGSSDLIGLRPLVITAEDVGSTIAQFAAVEIKTANGRTSPHQRNFLEFVTNAGGIARVVRSAEEVKS
jgi:hypothetical protein